MEKDMKKEKKRNLNTVEHSIKKEKKKRTCLGKIDSAQIVTKEKLNIYLNFVNFDCGPIL